MAPPVEGNGLALSTGTAGCSAYQIGSKPSRSAFRAMKAGSMVESGNGVDSPISMSVAFQICGWLEPGSEGSRSMVDCRISAVKGAKAEMPGIGLQQVATLIVSSLRGMTARLPALDRARRQS